MRNVAHHREHIQVFKFLALDTLRFPATLFERLLSRHKRLERKHLKSHEGTKWWCACAQGGRGGGGPPLEEKVAAEEEGGEMEEGQPGGREPPAGALHHRVLPRLTAKHVLKGYVLHRVLLVVFRIDAVGVLDVVRVDVLPPAGVPLLVPAELAVADKRVAWQVEYIIYNLNIFLYNHINNN